MTPKKDGLKYLNRSQIYVIGVRDMFEKLEEHYFRSYSYALRQYNNCKNTMIAAKDIGDVELYFGSYGEAYVGEENSPDIMHGILHENEYTFKSFMAHSRKYTEYQYFTKYDYTTQTENKECIKNDLL